MRLQDGIEFRHPDTQRQDNERFAVPARSLLSCEEFVLLACDYCLIGGYEKQRPRRALLRHGLAHGSYDGEVVLALGGGLEAGAMGAGGFGSAGDDYVLGTKRMQVREKASVPQCLQHMDRDIGMVTQPAL
ncbi:hypothetical protein [Embleya scabrispora]|uniref:hypothetical protein n=1 Tax=Embleya scabrispora TaxID=159449 RepID=UPI00099B7C2A|nr:hypothetical protein [Embleya scabrispora]